MTIKQSTINYAAKQAYQLFVMRGLTVTNNVGLQCQYFYSKTLEQAFILVRVIEQGETRIVPVKVRKSWINL